MYPMWRAAVGRLVGLVLTWGRVKLGELLPGFFFLAAKYRGIHSGWCINGGNHPHLLRNGGYAEIHIQRPFFDNKKDL
jgi:hypothetical protein